MFDRETEDQIERTVLDGGKELIGIIIGIVVKVGGFIFSGLKEVWDSPDGRREMEDVKRLFK